MERVFIEMKRKAIPKVDREMLGALYEVYKDTQYLLGELGELSEKPEDLIGDSWENETTMSLVEGRVYAIFQNTMEALGYTFKDRVEGKF